MELIVSLFINCILLVFIFRNKFIKQKYPEWVIQFYKEMNHSIKTNTEFTMDVSFVNDQEWLAMYKGIRNGHKFPLGFIDFTSEDLMVIKPQLYAGSRLKKFAIIMDYKPTVKSHSLKEHSPGPIDYKISYSKVIKD